MKNKRINKFKIMLNQKTKYILVHVLVTLFAAQFSLQAQTADDPSVSLNLKESTLKEIFKELETQTGFHFAYTDDITKITDTYTVKYTNERLSTVLTELAKKAGFEFKIANKKVSLKKLGKKELTGTLTDKQTGEPLIGVTINIKGTPEGTISDLNGKYSIMVPPNTSLVYSFVGYKTTEIEVGSNTTIDLALEISTTALDEVVVVGYGSLRRKDLTSSITTVSEGDFNTGSYTDPVQMLQGVVPGLTITNDGDPTSGATSIILRGASTLRTGQAQEPFYVIDGIPGASLSLVNMEDIVSIDVLRDASAAAIYGTRAANGVIMITTKRGQEKSKISYSSYVAIEKISNKIEMCSADEFRNYLSDNGYSLDPENDDGADMDWQDEVTQTGVSHNNNLSISGKSDRTTYFASVNYKKKEGIIRKTGLDRLNLRANLDQKVMDDKLYLGFSIANTVSELELIPNENELYESMLLYLPTVNARNEDGTFRENYNYASYNPVALIEQNTYDMKNKVFLGSAHARYFIFSDLDVEARASYQSSGTNSGRYYSKDSRLAYGLDGYAFRSAYESEKKILEVTSTYNKKINNHDFVVMAGYSWQEDKSGDGFQATNIGFVSDETGYYNLGLASPPDGYFPDYANSSITTLRIISGFSRFNYQFKNRYLLQATIRRDGSSAFGENNKWGTFPSFSLGWRITEEPFMKGINNLNNLKLRLGYGISGNSLGFNPLISQVRYSSSGKFYYNGEYINGVFPSQNANPDLKWEKTAMWNLGLDWSMFSGRFNGTVEVYDKLTEDLIWSYPVSTTKYYVSTLTTNVGSIQNRGIELTLNATPVQRAKFIWHTTVNVSSNKNEVKSLSNDEFQLDYIITASAGDHGQSGLYTQIIEEGYPIGQFHLLKYAGRNDEGVSQFYAADGSLTTSPTSDDYYYDGDAQPDAVFGWHNSITYKQWGLDFLFRGVTGNLILNTTLSNLNFPAEATHYNLPKMTLNEPINDTKAHYTSTRYLEKGDYVRLDNITLSYTFNIPGAYIKKLRLYTTVNNAFVITGYKGLDPEVNLGGQTPGIDNDNFYPKTRTFMCGVNVDF